MTPEKARDAAEQVGAVCDVLAGLVADDLEAFVADLRTQWAVEMGLIRIGETVNRIPAEVLQRFPDQPWRQIVAMRNFAAYQYDDLDPAGSGAPSRTMYPHCAGSSPRIVAYHARVSLDEGLRARIDDVHELALGMPHVTVENATGDNPVYQVGGKSFVFFRNPRRDAVDPHTGERYRDVIVFWVGSESDKLALVQDEASPFFTTAHFDGHPSVLLRASRVGELSRQVLAEVVQDAWLSRASARRAATWLSAHPPL